MYALPSSLPYVDLIPGPFILLILIPLLPLTLFSLGARPPGPSSLPILTDELWRTTILLGMAISVALAVGIYPDSMSDVVTWVKDGTVSVSSMKVGAVGGNWLGWGAVSTKAGGKRVMTPEMARRIARSRKPSFERVAANHIRALRYYHPRLYNASQPKLSSVVGLGLAITIVTIIVLGKVLRAVYESEKPRSSSGSGSGSGSQRPKSSGPSEWVQKEYAARKKGKSDETKTRFKKAEEELSKRYKEKKKSMSKEEYEKYITKKSEERRKDVDQLKKMLEQKKLEAVGLDKEPGWMVKSKSKDKSKDKEEEKEKKEMSTDTKNGEEVKAKKEKAEEKKADDPDKMTMGDKIRVALLGRTMANSMKKDKAKARAAPGAGVAALPPAVQAVPQRGQGWEVADNPTANAALAQSAGDAEALAKGMGK